MNKTKGILILGIILVLCGILIGASAENSGIWNDLNWTLSDDGTLVISGTGAMDDLSFNEAWLAQSPDIKNAVITNGVTCIGESAFYGCSSLTGITIPESVTSIGGWAFYGCSSLTSITIPDGVTSIGGYAFSGCSSLTSITIPDGVTYIGGGAFYECSNLTSITIPDSVTSIDNSTFSGCSSLTSITIPDSVTSIGFGAFERCRSLASITIPDSVTDIGTAAFSGCSSLTTITIPDGVDYLSFYTFSGCSSLTNITILNSLRRIDVGAFGGCNNLETVYYKENKPDEICYSAYEDNSALEKITWKKITESGELFTGFVTNDDSGRLLFYKDGIIASGWQTYEGEKYYCGENGAAYEGWMTVEGKTYYFSPEAITGRTCYLDKDGQSGYYTFGEDGALTAQPVVSAEQEQQEQDILQEASSLLGQMSNLNYKNSFYLTNGYYPLIISVKCNVTEADEDDMILVGYMTEGGKTPVSYRGIWEEYSDGQWNPYENYTVSSGSGVATMQGKAGTVRFRFDVTDAEGNTTSGFSDSIVVNEKHIHTEVIDPAKEATETETGLTEGKHCSVCGEILVAQREIPKLGKLDGDINGDGIVNGKDALRLMKWLAGETDEETQMPVEIVRINSDLNGDEVIDELDLLRLMRYLGGEKSENEELSGMKMMIGETAVRVEWENNESVKALRNLAWGGLTIQMSMYGGFEQVGNIGTILPRNDRQTTTSAGDIVLYSGNQLVVFYGSNSWSYTRLGRITDQSAGDMRELLSHGDVVITLSAD